MTCPACGGLLPSVTPTVLGNDLVVRCRAPRPATGKPCNAYARVTLTDAGLLVEPYPAAAAAELTDRRWRSWRAGDEPSAPPPDGASEQGA